MPRQDNIFCCVCAHMLCTSPHIVRGCYCGAAAGRILRPPHFAGRAKLGGRATLAVLALVFLSLPSALPAAPSQWRSSSPPRRALLSAGATSQDPCTSSCNPYLGPAQPGADYASGSTEILEGMLNGMRAKGTFGEKYSDAGYIGLGIMMVGLGIDSIAGGGKDETAWMFYDLEKALVQVEQYIVCMMEEIVSEAVYTITQTMKDDKVACFNEAVQGVVQQVAQRCRAWNCLNYTNIEPALRNAASGMNCMGAGAPYPPGTCDAVTAWNVATPTPCTTFDTFGKVQQGVCDPNKLCYYTNVGYTDVISEINNILDAFLKNSCINNLQALNSYYDATSMAAYAQASLVKLQLLQQKVLLGAVDGSVGDINQYAGSVADWMATRLDYNLDYQRQYDFVVSISYSDSYSIDGKATWDEAPPDGRCTRMDYFWNVGTYCREKLYTRESCASSVTVSALQCTPAKPGSKCMIRSGQPAGCGGSNATCSPGSSRYPNPDCEKEVEYDCMVQNCGFNCNSDSCYNACRGQVDATYDALTQKLLANITATLSNFTLFTEQMRNVSAVGFPPEWYGIYRTSYPFANCTFNTTYASGYAGYAAAAMIPAAVAELSSDAMVSAYAAAAVPGAAPESAAAGASGRVLPWTLPVVALASRRDVSGARGLRKGAITAAALRAALPGRAPVVARRLRCPALLAALNAGVAAGAPLRPSRNLQYSFDTSRPEGRQVVRASLRTPSGASLDLLKCRDSRVIVLASSKAAPAFGAALDAAPVVLNLRAAPAELVARHLDIFHSVDAPTSRAISCQAQPSHAMCA